MASPTVMSADLGYRFFDLPADLSAEIGKIAKQKWNLSFDRSADFKIMAQSVLRMSDFYAEHPADETPWNETWCQQAQLIYFLPLNFVRNQAVIQEGLRSGFFEDIQTATDFGAGLGAASLALKFARPEISIDEIEISTQARDLRKDLDGFLARNTSGDRGASGRLETSDLFVASYSLTENQINKLQSQLTRFSSLMIIEPSTQDDARRLMKLRETLIPTGYSVWAPCTHQRSCPLLVESQRDWCHDRIHFRAPDWFRALETHLPMKNENLTFSYLLLSKRPAPVQKHARITGDYLREKGKSRQLICRGEKREFLSMLHRDGVLPEYSRGALIEVPPDGTSIGTEYRLKTWPK